MRLRIDHLPVRLSPEMIVVSAIIVLLLTLVAPLMLSQRDHARRQQRQNKFEQLGLALHGYHDTHQRFPTVVAPKSRQEEPKHPPKQDLITPL